MSHDKPGIRKPHRASSYSGRGVSMPTHGGVAVPGFEPGCPLGHVLLRDACIRSTRQRDSPCLLVKGADCAGVCDAFAWRVVPVFPGFGRPGYLLA